jgi:transcriptional/translational regulatory protein YebC/TACO1
VRVGLEQASIAVESADVSFLPSMSVPLDDETGRKVLRLVDALEDSDDVQNVWANFDVSDDVLEAVSG